MTVQAQLVFMLGGSLLILFAASWKRSGFGIVWILANGVFAHTGSQYLPWWTIMALAIIIAAWYLRERIRPPRTEERN